MNSAPFPLLQQFDDLVDIRFFSRADNISSDNDITRLAGSTHLVGLVQEHGNRAVVLREESSRVVVADGVCTDQAGLTLSIRFADCQSAVILAPTHGVIALVHAGWKGVRSRMMSSAYSLLQEEWGITPQQTWLGLGPSLCTTCADFTDPAREVPELSSFIHSNCIDLRAALDAELDDIGVPQDQRQRMPDCTRCYPEKYFTYRGANREFVKSGFRNGFAVTLRAS